MITELDHYKHLTKKEKKFRIIHKNIKNNHH